MFFLLPICDRPKKLKSAFFVSLTVFDLILIQCSSERKHRLCQFVELLSDSFLIRGLENKNRTRQERLRYSRQDLNRKPFVICSIVRFHALGLEKITVLRLVQQHPQQCGIVVDSFVESSIFCENTSHIVLPGKLFGIKNILKIDANSGSAMSSRKFPFIVQGSGLSLARDWYVEFFQGIRPS